MAATSLIQKLGSFAEKHLTTVVVALFVPLGGLWLNVNQEARQSAELRRERSEQLSVKHQQFLNDISDRLMRNQLRFLLDEEKVFEAEFVINKLNPLLDEVGEQPRISKEQLNVYQKILRQSLDKHDDQRILGNLLSSRLQNLASTEPSELIDYDDERAARSRKLKQTLEFIHGLQLLGGSILNIGNYLDLVDVDLSKARLACSSLLGVRIVDSIIKDAVLDFSFLLVVIENSRMDLTDFRDSIFDGSVKNSHFERSNFDHAMLDSSLLYGSFFKNASFKNASLYNVRLEEHNDFSGADLRGADLRIAPSSFKNNIAKTSRNSAGLFRGAFANTRSVVLADGTALRPTILPEQATLASLGLIEWNRSDAPPPHGPRLKYSSATIFNVPPYCTWRQNKFRQMLELRKKRAAPSIKQGQS